MNKINRIKELVELLNYYRNEYYNNSNNAISDFEYDQLFDELVQLESETGFIMSVSPTQTVGYEVKSELKKVEHNHAMLSLDKTKSIDDLKNFLGDRNGILMLKMDGLTVSLRYVNGHLVSAETRGNGEIGEDILHNAKVFSNIPLQINYQDELIVDGEAIITYDAFERINANLPEGEKYRCPRNLASGSVRQLDSKIASERNIKFIAWKMVKGSDSNSFNKRLNILHDLGFEVTPRYILNQDVIGDLIDCLKSSAERNNYPIDGMVLGYDDIAYGDSLGATGHHLRSQIAYKFYDELYETKLSYIDWTMGKTGILTPTAVFEPIEIDGTEVSRASLHNISIIKSLGLTNGCTVRVYKANQIIPQIDSCEQDGDNEIAIPSVCPICGWPTVVKKDNESEVLMCSNPDCSAKKIAQFTHFVSRKAMNIDGLSEKTLETLISHGFMRELRDIYHLSDHKNELIYLDGFGKKSVENLLKSIEESRKVNLANFICALGIPTIGSSASKTIAEYCEYDIATFLKLLWESRWNTDFNWTELNDFGEVAAKNLDEYFDKNVKMLRELADEMNFIIPEKKAVANNPFTGKTLCVTGKLNHFTRDGINEKIASLGAKAAGSVSKKTDYLITNESSGSSKYKKAVELGVPIITEEEFINMAK